MHESEERRRRLESILADFLQAAEKGQALDQRDLLSRHPDLADELFQGTPLNLG